VDCCRYGFEAIPIHIEAHWSKIAGPLTSASARRICKMSVEEQIQDQLARKKKFRFAESRTVS